MVVRSLSLSPPPPLPICQCGTIVGFVYFAIWPVPYTFLQAYHPGNGSHGQLFHHH